MTASRGLGMQPVNNPTSCKYSLLYIKNDLDNTSSNIKCTSVNVKLNVLPLMSNTHTIYSRVPYI